MFAEAHIPPLSEIPRMYTTEYIPVQRHPQTKRDQLQKARALQPKIESLQGLTSSLFMQREKVLKLIMNQASLLKTMNRPSLKAATTLKQSCCDFKYFQQITSSLSKPL